MKRIFILVLMFLIYGCVPVNQQSSPSFDISAIPNYSNEPYVILNENMPQFEENDYTTLSYEKYQPLDGLGRCQMAMACIGKDLMPTGDRGSIGQIKPSGWQLQKYDFIDGKYLYNRCHLIGFQLTGETTNECNLITGTRYMNIVGMLPFENRVASYIRQTNHHVLYRVTPIFIESELVCRGVQLEAYSIEDNGEGICLNVFIYNVQPNIEIDYSTGNSQQIYLKQNYVLNAYSKKFHYPTCETVEKMWLENRKDIEEKRNIIIEMGYEPCGFCQP